MRVPAARAARTPRGGVRSPAPGQPGNVHPGYPACAIAPPYGSSGSSAPSLQPVPPVAHGVVGAPRRAAMPPPAPARSRRGIAMSSSAPRRRVRRVAAGVRQRPRHLVRALLAAAGRECQAPRLRRVCWCIPGGTVLSALRTPRACAAAFGVRARLGPASPATLRAARRGAPRCPVGVRPSSWVPIARRASPRGDPLPEMKFAGDIFTKFQALSSRSASRRFHRADEDERHAVARPRSRRPSAALARRRGAAPAARARAARGCARGQTPTLSAARTRRATGQRAHASSTTASPKPSIPAASNVRTTASRARDDALGGGAGLALESRSSRAARGRAPSPRRRWRSTHEPSRAGAWT